MTASNALRPVMAAQKAAGAGLVVYSPQLKICRACRFALQWKQRSATTSSAGPRRSARPARPRPGGSSAGATASSSPALGQRDTRALRFPEGDAELADRFVVTETRKVFADNVHPAGMVDRSNRRIQRPITSYINTDAFACALWIGSLLVAVDPAANPFPARLDEFVTTYLALVRPAAQA